MDGILLILKLRFVTFCKKFINRISCSIKENDMELKAYVRFLREEGDVPVKEIVHRCGISRASVYRCLKSANQAQKKSKKHGRPRLIDVRQERKIQRTIARLREQEGNFSCHSIKAEAGLYNLSLWTINRTQFEANGIRLLGSKRKGILLEKDFRERLRFAREKNLLQRLLHE